MKNKPLRMCVSCRESRNKDEMIRVVRNKDGEVSIDTTGRKNGRGAYICADKSCIEKARKNKALERAFKSQINTEIYDLLEKALD